MRCPGAVNCHCRVYIACAAFSVKPTRHSAHAGFSRKRNNTNIRSGVLFYFIFCFLFFFITVIVVLASRRNGCDRKTNRTLTDPSPKRQRAPASIRVRDDMSKSITQLVLYAAAQLAFFASREVLQVYASE